MKLRLQQTAQVSGASTDVLPPGDKCKMLLHSSLLNTNARISYICHILHRVANNSTRWTMLRFHGCLSRRAMNMVIIESVRISDNRHPSDESCDWLVRDLVSHHINRLVNQADLATVYKGHATVRPHVNQAVRHTTWYIKFQVEVDRFCKGATCCSADTSGVSGRNLGFDRFWLYENRRPMSHLLSPILV